jgi:hypothetical protein
MEQPKPESQEKKTYEKPRLTQVRMVPAETVLGTCKFNTGAKATCNGDSSCTSQPRS